MLTSRAAHAQPALLGRSPRRRAVRTLCTRPLATSLALGADSAHSMNGSSSHHHAADELERLLGGQGGAPYRPPAPLPPTPSAATLGAVMPYLARLGLGDGQLYWRVGAALAALFA